MFDSESYPPTRRMLRELLSNQDEETLESSPLFAFDGKRSLRFDKPSRRQVRKGLKLGRDVQRVKRAMNRLSR